MRKLTTMCRAALVLAVSAGVPVIAAVRGPDAAGYTATDATVYSFVDVSSGGASVLAGTDDGTAPLTLPFAFTFYGQAYSQVCVSSNGVLYFVASASCGAVNDFANIDLALTTPNDWPALFPYWTDLSFQAPGAGSVYYQTTGSAGSRRFVVQWNKAMPGASASPVTFEVVLAEGSNTILFQYKTVTLGAGNPASNGALATIGIRNSGGSASNKVLQWSVNAPVLRDGSAILFGNGSSSDSVPPVVTAAATPDSLWPPNGKAVNVTVRGRIQDASSGINPSSVRYSVADSYGQVQPNGTFTLAADGTYAFTIPLVAERQGSDKNGRTYTITVRAADTAGNVGSATAVVTVPHDQRK